MEPTHQLEKAGPVAKDNVEEPETAASSVLKLEESYTAVPDMFFCYIHITGILTI